MPEAAIPIVAEGAVGLTAAEIASAQAAAQALAATQAAQAAAAAQAATNASVLSAIAPAAAPAATTAATTAASALPAAATPMAAGPATVGLGGAPAGTVLGSGSGIQALANEVGATSAFNTPAATLTQYGAGAPVSTPLTSATPFNPAAPMANPTYAQPSGLQGLQTNLNGPLGSNLPPPSVTQAVTSAGTGAPPETDILKQMINPNGAERFAGTQNLIENPASVPSDMYTKESLRVPLDEQLGRMPTEAIPNTTIPAQATTSAAEPNFLQELYKDFKGMSVPNKILTGMAASSAYDMLNRPKPYEKPKYKSTWNAGAYSGYDPVQPTPYTPHYAGGGWAGILPALQKSLEKTGLLKHKSSFDPSKYTAANTEPPTPYQPQYAHGGIADLGGYSDGGRMLKGPGDGMSDDIPATIANKQPARLANEEFVIPADVVSHLGNGSSEAGAKQLYKMMDRVRKARTGNKKQGKQINPEKYLA